MKDFKLVQFLDSKVGVLVIFKVGSFDKVLQVMFLKSLFFLEFQNAYGFFKLIKVVMFLYILYFGNFFMFKCDDYMQSFCSFQS